MGKKKKNYQVRNSAGKKYNGSKESKQKAVAKQNASRPKSQLLDDPIKDDVKVVGGATEAKEPNRIEELKSQIEKLQADKQAYYEGAENGESEILAAERKDTNSIDRTKIDVEIYRLQKELRELLYKETEANKAQETKENKPEEKENMLEEIYKFRKGLKEIGVAEVTPNVYTPIISEEKDESAQEEIANEEGTSEQGVQEETTGISVPSEEKVQEATEELIKQRQSNEILEEAIKNRRSIRKNGRNKGRIYSNV